MQGIYPLKKLSVLNLWFIAVCALFVFSLIMTFWEMQGLHNAMLGFSLTFVILIPVAFANIGWLLLFRSQSLSHSLHSKKKYYLASYTFSTGFFVSIVCGYNYLHSQSITLIDLITLVIISTFVNTLIIMLHQYIILQEIKTNADVENSLLKAANAEAANQLLRQQIHPHFLFNALNILKSLYKVEPKAAEEYLVCLSDFLRASVSNNNIKLVRLKDEIKLCQDYLRMQEIRFGNALICCIAISENALESGFVPSFSIQPLLENAIKHNELTEEQPLHIFIKQNDDRISVSNNIKPKLTSEGSTGSGLANLSERYKIISNDTLLIEADETTFSVSIKILNHGPSMQRYS